LVGSPEVLTARSTRDCVLAALMKRIEAYQALGLLGVVSDARKRDHGSVSSATTVSAYEQACARQLWKVPDRGSIAAHTFASSRATEAIGDRVVTGWIRPSPAVAFGSVAVAPSSA
jgi:hypothetical protein